MLHLVILLTLGLHPDSLSASRVQISGDEALVTVRCQVVSLREVIPGLDANRDDVVTVEEIEAKRDWIFAYVGEHYRLQVGTDREYRGGRRLDPEPITIECGPPGVRDGIPFREGSVDVALRFAAGEPIEDAAIEMSLFFETSPAHIDIARIEWQNGPSQSFGLDSRGPRARVDPEGRGTFPLFLRRGFQHLLSGLDHLVLLLALLLSARSLRALSLVFIPFIGGHSLSLALAALEVVTLNAYTDFISAAVALSIAYVGIDNLVHAREPRPRWIEALLFAFALGLGCGTRLDDTLVGEGRPGLAVLSFNLGIDLGLLLLAAAAALLLRVRQRRSETADDAVVAPPLLVRLGSTAIALLGLFWFLARI